MLLRGEPERTRRKSFERGNSPDLGVEKPGFESDFALLLATPQPPGLAILASLDH